MSSEPRDISTLSDKTGNELERLNSKNHNCNTKKSTSMWMNVFDDWRARRKIMQKLEEIPKENLDEVLQLFFLRDT